MLVFIPTSQHSSVMIIHKLKMQYTKSTQRDTNQIKICAKDKTIPYSGLTPMCYIYFLSLYHYRHGFPSCEFRPYQ